MKLPLLLFSLALGCLLLTANAQTPVNEPTKLRMFRAALANASTAPNYVVVVVKNRATGELKEVCTEAPFMEGAVQRENGSALSPDQLKSRYFEFSSKDALRNVGFDIYTPAELSAFARTVRVAEVVEQVKTDKLTSKIFSGGRKVQFMFAHLMFNNGVMMTRGYLVGNVCELAYLGN